MIKNRYQVALLLSLFVILGLGFIAGQTGQQKPKPKPAEWSGDSMKGWQQYDQLVKEQKYEAASSLVEEMLAKARSGKNSTEWTRCLIRYTQLRMALHGYETSVRFLKDQPWPEDLTGSSVLNLYYAHALTNYARSYSWEINAREKIDTKGLVDLKAWTRDQIYEEAQKAFEIVWKVRAQLGETPNTGWKEFLTPNNYPPGIRPTLRDAVSYLRVEMLADTNGWQPDQLNEIYRLNLKNLIEGSKRNIPHRSRPPSSGKNQLHPGGPGKLARSKERAGSRAGGPARTLPAASSAFHGSGRQKAHPEMIWKNI